MRLFLVGRAKRMPAQFLLSNSRYCLPKTQCLLVFKVDKEVIGDEAINNAHSLQLGLNAPRCDTGIYDLLQ